VDRHNWPSSARRSRDLLGRRLTPTGGGLGGGPRAGAAGGGGAPRPILGRRGVPRRPFRDPTDRPRPPGKPVRACCAKPLPRRPFGDHDRPGPPREAVRACAQTRCHDDRSPTHDRPGPPGSRQSVCAKTAAHDDPFRDPRPAPAPGKPSERCAQKTAATTTRFATTISPLERSAGLSKPGPGRRGSPAGCAGVRLGAARTPRPGPALPGRPGRSRRPGRGPRPAGPVSPLPSAACGPADELRPWARATSSSWTRVQRGTRP